MGTLKKYQSPPYVQERPLELLPFTPLSNPANAQGPSLRSAAGAKFWMRQNLRLESLALLVRYEIHSKYYLRTRETTTMTTQDFEI
jgi:hypothetical protein